MKTRLCEECQFADYSGDLSDLSDLMVCGKGHRPRFYLPKGEYPHYSDDWGWKRKCADYSEGTPTGITVCEVSITNCSRSFYGDRESTA